jgi:hypothetical protein
MRMKNCTLEKLLQENYNNLIGAIAQLGERLNGIQEVRGSIPRSSTNPLLEDFYQFQIFIISRDVFLIFN